jgi:hypothetical protein
MRSRAAAFVIAMSMSALSACEDRGVDLTEALAPARGHVVDGEGRDADIGAVLDAARGRPVSVSFAYVGCNRRVPRLERLRSAEAGVGGDVFHIVLNAVDEPTRYPDVVQDLTGEAASRLDPNRLRILFVRKGDLWPQRPSEAVEGVMNAIGFRYGRDRFVETVSGIGLFDASGRFAGIRY